MPTYAYPEFAYRPPQDLLVGAPQRRPLIVVGAGPVGLAAAIDARLHGLPVLLLDEDATVSLGSRAVCYAKRTLEILDRLGVGEAACQRGVSWNVGRTFLDEQEVYRFDLVAEPGHKRPGMINLQQYHLEDMLVARAQALGVDLRWRYQVVGVQNQADHIALQVQTPDGPLAIEADWLIVADGARSPLRRALGLDTQGHVFMDRFLIADVVMQADYPAERWLWFDPPFHRGQTVLLHKQSDDVWRIDFQLGWDADPEQERQPERVIPRIQAMLGDKRPFTLEWVSIYTFQCRRMKDFRAGRALFVGDAAHQVSPFGARGANSGIQDADDLVWKLALVIQGLAPHSLLDSYSEDRRFAADENILNSTRSTDFITPKSRVSQTFRDAVLHLAREHPFARKLVNSGRLSMPSVLTASRLNTPDTDTFSGDMVPGAPLADAPLLRESRATWLLDEMGGAFTLLLFAPDSSAITPALQAELDALRQQPIAVHSRLITADGSGNSLADVQGLAAQRYDAQHAAVYLIRPDQHVAARWRGLSLAGVPAALARASGQPNP